MLLDEDKMSEPTQQSDLEARLSAIEEASTKWKSENIPWWKKGASVTALTAVVGAVIGSFTAVDGHYKNQREADKQIIEQQDKIRQTYLDRVLKTGITEIERQRIFTLLAKMKSDPELQEWAKEELKKVTDEVDRLKKAKEQLETKLREKESDLDSAAKQVSQLTGLRRKEARERLQSLADQARAEKQKLESVRTNLGETNAGTYSSLSYLGFLRQSEPILSLRFIDTQRRPVANLQVSILSAPISLTKFLTDSDGRVRIPLYANTKAGDMIFVSYERPAALTIAGTDFDPIPRNSTFITYPANEETIEIIVTRKLI